MINNDEAIKYSIGVLMAEISKYEKTYNESVHVKERIEREPEEFTWKWSGGGYWVSVYNNYPKMIANLQTGIKLLEKEQEEQG
jgi:hypothetical protein